ANRNDPTERANALFQAAAIWEDALKRDDMAVEVYEEVLRLMPAHVPSIRALERLYGSKGNVKELVTVLDREAQSAKTPNAQLAARLKLARMYLDRLNEPARAAQYCEAALAIDPENLFALKTLERLRATDRTRRSELKLRLSDKVADGRLRAALKLSAALDGDGANAGQASEDLKRAFDEDPNDSRLAFALERVLRQTGDDAGLAAFYERRLEGLEDVQEKLELTLRVADLAEVRNGDLRKALGCFRRATELMPNFLPAITGVRRVALKLGDFAAAREAWEAEARATRDVRSAIDAYVAAARLCAGPLKDADSAIANYRKALERDPLDASATAGLEGLLAERGGSEDLALLHEKRGEAKLAQKDLIAASQAFFSAAKLWLGEGKGERAVAAVDRALSAQPSYGDALELKGELCLKAGQYAEAAAAYSVRVQQGGNAQVLARLHRLLGSIYHDHLSDLTRATAHLQTALSGNSADVEALERLASIHTLSRNWTGAADCLKRLLELVKEPEALARHTLALAQIFDQGFADPAQASALYRRALELVPGDASVIERLADLYQRMGNLPELIQMLEKQAVMTEDKARALALRLKIGDLYAKSLQSPQQAVASYKQAVQLDPSSVAAHVALADLYGRDAAAAPLAIDEHRTLLKLDPTRVESLHVLFRIWEGLRQPDRAYAVAGVLQFLRAATETEIAFYSEARNALPAELPKPLGFGELDLLMHPHARNPAVEILRAVGDQLTRIYPPDFESMGVDRKNDKLRTDHAAYRAIKAMAQSVGVEDFDVYLSRGSTLTLETSEPLGVCIGQEVVRKFSAREQRFLIGRAVFGLFNRAAVIGKISEAELANLIGNSVRIYEPYYDGMGERNEELTKQLRKAYSRKALKALEAPSRSLMATKVDLATTVKGLHASHHRAGLLLCGDVAAGLNALLRDDPQSASLRIEGTDSVVHALRQRPDLQDLMAYALSDEFFSVRQKVGVAIQKG
ncbi:MAG TPA: tetratricopeptide repeat protein, partial [Myxococcaceae bacterium]|nr:tetratricopeptide repeat protein [Myxococcaceae bacterium]